MAKLFGVETVANLEKVGRVYKEENIKEEMEEQKELDGVPMEIGTDLWQVEKIELEDWEELPILPENKPS